MNAHSVTFDKIVYLDRLKLAGVPEDVARAHADGLDQALRESVATRHDVEKVESSLRSHIEKVETALRSDLAKVETALRSDLAKVETALRNDLEKVETSLRTDVTAVRADLEKVEAKLDAKIDLSAATLRTEIANSAVRLSADFNSTIYKAVGLIGAFIAACPSSPISGNSPAHRVVFEPPLFPQVSGR